MISRLANTGRVALSSAVRMQQAQRVQVARFTQTAAATKLNTVLTGELKHEKEAYEAPDLVRQFASNKEWTFEDKDGDVNMALTKKVGDSTIRVEWQLVSPFDPEMDEEMTEEVGVNESTDFTVTVENKDAAGMTFYCSTQKGDNHRFVIGSCKSYGSAAERDSHTAYNGPEFEDLDEKLQEALDEYLGELGLGNPVFDFIDCTAADKEQREYIRWLNVTKTFLA
eukprot:GEMP01045076.1.p1 GENE.GEMP01045076.1~~GEMP01045076.1.p1  ORF type:complete len:235 (+),score=71.76 GEMP01045076.1:32-706(+)